MQKVLPEQSNKKIEKCIVTKDTMDKILLLTKQDDFIMENYQLLSKDNLSEKEYDKYIKKYPNAENKEVYVII